MAYIRTKTIRGDKYMYIVKSIWDSERQTSRQKIIKYLGKANQVSLSDIPSEYRNSRILNSISATTTSKDCTREYLKEATTSLYGYLTQGRMEQAIEIFEEHTKNYSTDLFFEKILGTVMRSIGSQWERGELSIAAEHIASNTARGMLAVIRSKTVRPRSGERVLICSPCGEEHCLGCDIIQIFLERDGFVVSNLSPAMPAANILDFMQKNKPDIVLISVTIQDNLPTTKRLVSKIRSKFEIPIVVGGQAVDGIELEGAIAGPNSLQDIAKVVKKAARKAK